MLLQDDRPHVEAPAAKMELSQKYLETPEGQEALRDLNLILLKQPSTFDLDNISQLSFQSLYKGKKDVLQFLEVRRQLFKLLSKLIAIMMILIVICMTRMFYD